MAMLYFDPDYILDKIAKGLYLAFGLSEPFVTPCEGMLAKLVLSRDKRPIVGARKIINYFVSQKPELITPENSRVVSMLLDR